jgi:putative chitinase
MCISGSVGQGGRNARGDVRTIQILLNLSANALSLPAPLAEDGAIGPATLGALAKFQRQIVGTATPSSLVEPGSATLQRLQTSLGQGFNSTKVKGIMINAAETGVNRYSAALAKCMQDRQINTPLRQAHFLAQIGHESGELRYAEEIASGAAYEGRSDLGNTQPGDGVRFKGRGLIQLTGRANYAKYGQSIGRDLVTDGHWTQVAEDPALAVDVASWYWDTRQLNKYADLDDIVTVTKRINGGDNGLEDRKALLNRGKFFLLVDSGTAGH